MAEEGEVEERQSATARRRGSGSFLRKEDLNLEKVARCILVLGAGAGLRQGLKVVEGEEDIDMDE